MQKTNAKTVQINLGTLTLTEARESKGGRPVLTSGKLTKPEGDYYITFYAGPKPEPTAAKVVNALNTKSKGSPDVAAIVAAVLAQLGK